MNLDSLISRTNHLPKAWATHDVRSTELLSFGQIVRLGLREVGVLSPILDLELFSLKVRVVQ
jgi:hypothetical protein